MSSHIRARNNCGEPARLFLAYATRTCGFWPKAFLRDNSRPTRGRLAKIRRSERIALKSAARWRRLIRDGGRWSLQ